MKHGIALSLSLCLLFTGIFGSAAIALAADNLSPNAPDGLLMELSRAPLGIKAAAPEFSWVVNDPDKDEVQTAYQILVATDPQQLSEEAADIWNSGKVSSAESSHVAYGGEAIPADGIYWWTVRIWDKNDAASPYAQPQFFSTAVKDNWQANAIWSKKTVNTITPVTLFEQSGLTDYILETDFVITSNALGICFRKTANNGTAQDMYMWQIRATTASSGALLKPHIAKGTSITVQGSAIDLSTYGITINTGETHKLKIACVGSEIKTYIDGKQVATHTRTEYAYGTFGFRNGSSESGSVDNLKISKPDGTVLYSWNFDDGKNPMSGGSIQNGSLQVGKGQKFFYVVPSTMTALVDYGMECDFTIDDVALGFSVRKQENTTAENYCYMFQVAAATGSSNATLKSQMISVGAGSAVNKISNVNLTSLGLDIRAGEQHHIKILCQGSTIKIWIDQTLCATISNATEYPAGNFGIRCGNSESGTVDNLKITDVNGAVLYENDFTDGSNPFTNGGTVSNGALKVGKGQKLYYAAVSEGLSEKGNIIFLRKDFSLAKPVKKALVSAIGKSRTTILQYNFKLYVNGSCAGLGSPVTLKDGIYNNVYSTFDVTELLCQGDNTVGAICYAVDDQRFQMQMKVFYADGTTELIVTDDSWKSLDGTRIYGDDGTTLGGNGNYTAMAENINANLFPYGWNEPGYDDSAWNPVAIKTTITDLIASPIENMTEYEMPVRSVVDKGNGNYFITLEKEIIGGLRLTLPNGVENAKLTMLYGEQTSGENAVKWQMCTGNTYREYWTLKSGSQVIESFGMKGFRYIEIQNCPVAITADMIKGVAYRQAFDDDDASFHSSNQILNDIFDLVQYTIKATNQDIYVDSQTRERSYGNSGDVYVNVKSSHAVSRSYTLAWYTTHCMDVITQNGYQISEYNIHAILTAWEMYRYTGNADILAQDYDHFVRLLRLDHLNEETGLFWFQHDTTFRDLVDWPNAERDGYQVFDCYYNTVVNSYQYKGLLTVANIAQVLGKTEDAAKYRAMAADLKESINSTFFNVNGDGLYIEGMKQDGTLVTGTATPATIYPLLHGLVDDPQDFATALKYVAGKGFTGSVFGAQFLLELLYNTETGDRAYELLTDTGMKSWAHMMYDLGATITTEAWDPSRKPNMSFSHPWGSAAGNAMVEGLCGITPLSAGYSSIQIKPQLGDLEFVSLKTPTIKGSILLEVTTQEAGYSTVLTANIPANTTARVYVPLNGSQSSLAVVDGVMTTAAREGDYLVFENVGSGGHTFAIPDASLDISGADVTLSQSEFPYDGTEKKPTVTVILDGMHLSEGTDYTVSYQRNGEITTDLIAPGTVTVVISGTSPYSGTHTATYSITGKTAIEDTSLTFCGAGVVLYHDLGVDFKVNSALLDGYTDSYVVFRFNGKEVTAQPHSAEANGKSVFRFRNIAPHMISDTICATLYATKDGVLYAGKPAEYSVTQYCYRMLETYSEAAQPAYSELRTLLVDLLNYGAAAQQYMNYRTDDLANSALSSQQKAWGTQTEPTAENQLDTKYEIVAAPTVLWVSGGLRLEESVTVRFTLETESLDGLTVKLKVAGKEYSIDSSQLKTTDTAGRYLLYFSSLNAGQMREPILATAYANGNAVSNTVLYSIESYVAEKQNDPDALLAALVKAMLCYGDSAYSFVN